MHSDTAHVLCRNPECGASYDKKVSRDPAQYAAQLVNLAHQGCEVCSGPNVVVTEARGPKPVRV